MVTPPGKVSYLKVTSGSVNPARVSDDGNTILYMPAGGPLAESAPHGMPTYERARRGDEGWNVERALPPIRAPYVDTLAATPTWLVASHDLNRVMFVTSTVHDPAQTFAGPTQYNGSAHLGDGADFYHWLSKPTWAGASPVQGDPDMRSGIAVPAGGSDNFDVVYFNSLATLTSEDGASGRNALESWSVYKFKDGQLSNAGILPDGTISRGGSIAAGFGPTSLNSSSVVEGGSSDRYRANTVSSNGKSLLFVSPDPLRAAQDATLPKPQLYRAVEGQQSELISAPEGEDGPISGTEGVVRASGLPGGTAPAIGYTLATPDHSVIIFSSRDALTDGANSDPSVAKTYRYESETGELTHLADLDRPANSVLGRAIELHESGNYLLYRTQSGDLKLWRNGKSTVLISAGTAEQPGTAVSTITHARIVADGEVIVLNSTGALRGNPDHLPGSGSQNYRSQVYRYEVAADELECISCIEGGTTTGASISLWGARNGYTTPTNTARSLTTTRSVTPDGKRVYFTTRTPLVDEDHNSVDDVYEWHDGELRLISTGSTGSLGELLIDINSDASTVAFVSAEQLVESDKDEMYDVYVAKVNGGVDPPQPAKTDSGCTGAECQGVPEVAPDAPPAASVDFAGPGNVKQAPEPQVRANRVGKIAGAVARLRVRVPTAGRIVVNGRAVRRTARRAPRAGAYTVRVALTPKAKRELRRRGAVTTSVRTVFRSPDGAVSRSLRLTFKRVKAKRSHAVSGRGQK